MIPGRSFPFPKSLYAVEDAIRFFVKPKATAVVLDFFAGSATTTHAVMRLNRQDGGRRSSIVVTNNEVSADEAARLRVAGAHPGDAHWEAEGIFAHVAMPRIKAATTGRTPDGAEVSGDYRFVDQFPMSTGFDENAAFMELEYPDADKVDLGLAFDVLAPLLWLRAGGAGPMLSADDITFDDRPFKWTEHYGVLLTEDHWRAFVRARPQTAATAFVWTYSPTSFAGIAAELPQSMDVVRLPDTYLSMFQPDRGRA